MQNDDNLEQLMYQVKGICMNIHRELGCGLLESAYSKVLAHALIKNGFQVKTECPISIKYDGIEIDNAFRADMIVNDTLLIELKAVEKILKVHHLQMGSYMQLGNFPAGLLVNFHSPNLRNEMFTQRLSDLNKRYL